MATIVRISGPNVCVSCSMKIILIQKRKAVAARSQSKWKSPELISSSSFCIKRCYVVGCFSRAKPSLSAA